MRRFLWTAFAVGDAAWDTASAIAQFASTSIRIRFVRFWGVGVYHLAHAAPGTSSAREAARRLLGTFGRPQVCGVAVPGSRRP